MKVASGDHVCSHKRRVAWPRRVIDQTRAVARPVELGGTHPGPSFIIVTAGTITAYEGDDASCTPHVYSALPGFPNSFVDPGGGHVHLVRNEDAAVVATGYAVQLIPQAATRRIDAPAPDNCSF